MSTDGYSPDFQAALRCALGQPRLLEALAFVFRIADAKRPETRARRIQQFTEKLADHEPL
jgi:uncharacterized protein YdeI (YjbR/CyaY-like superfamily)